MHKVSNQLDPCRDPVYKIHYINGFYNPKR
ncbi:hypothetical protein IWQ51_006720 [Labrenzia sp. EL_142]|nr:hypothetical protein [Labrenzia sp. EL_142]